MSARENRGKKREHMEEVPMRCAMGKVGRMVLQMGSVVRVAVVVAILIAVQIQ